MIDKISINGTLYAVTPVPEGEQPSGSTVTVDGVTYLIGTAITAPAEMAQQAIEKIQVNGVLYDIADVEAVEAETRRAMEAEGALSAAINSNANNLAEAEKNIANQLFATPDTDKVTITGRNEQSKRINFEANIPAATEEKAGVMTAADRKKLNNLAVEGTNTDLNTYFHEGVYLFRHTLLTNAPIPSDSVVSARLTVLTAYDGTSPVITQVLNLNNLSGGEGNIYIRSKQNDTWKPWGKLQTNVEVEQIVKEEENRAKEAEGKLEEKIAKEKTALVNGDIIVGQAREVYSRTGKVDSATFLKRTTAGGTSVSDGVASVKQIGGNIVKNLVDGRFVGAVVNRATFSIYNNIAMIRTSKVDASTGAPLYGDLSYAYEPIEGHVYYHCVCLYNVDAKDVRISINGAKEFASSNKTGEWVFLSYHGAPSIYTVKFIKVRLQNNDNIDADNQYGGNTCFVKNWFAIDLTEMYGAGNEPTKEECDRMFACMGALPQGLTVAQPTGLKSTGFNQWNPANVLLNKSIVENAIEDDVADRHIAIVECLPCKIGTGENNGYIIGYGEGDSWNVEGIEVYFSPLNPMDYIGQDVDLYMHKLEADSDYSSYVPQCKGYLLIVTPTIDKLCVHFHWSGDREITDYEEYVESNVALPTIPEMSEWGLAGISARGTIAIDTIDLDRMIYTKRIGRVDMGTLGWARMAGGHFYAPISGMNGRSVLTNMYTTVEPFIDGRQPDYDKVIAANAYLFKSIFIIDKSFSTAVELKESLKGVIVYFPLETPEEYPIVTKSAPNYIGSDYGVEEFTGSKVPLAANILFYMRSLVSETRNFLDRLMARLGISDATAVADKIADVILPQDTPTEETDVEPTTVIEE